jgi:hypothetical protein
VQPTTSIPGEYTTGLSINLDPAINQALLSQGSNLF